MAAVDTLVMETRIVGVRAVQQRMVRDTLQEAGFILDDQRFSRRAYRWRATLQEPLAGGVPAIAQHE